MDINVVKEAVSEYHKNTKYCLEITYNNILNTKRISHGSGVELSVYYNSLKVITPNKEIFYYDISYIVRIMLIIV